MAATNDSFSVGDIIFAKIKSYPHWPGKIIGITPQVEKKSPKYNVLFYGDSKTAEINSKDLFLYVKHKSVYGLPKTDNLKNRTFNKALKEADTAIGLAKAIVRTNKNKTDTTSSSGVHSGPHSVTMKALQTPSPARTLGRVSLTAHAEIDTSKLAGCPTTPSNELPLTRGDSEGDGSVWTPEVPPSDSSALQTENAKLRTEMARLREERQALLNHSIESDTRLLKYTEEIFTQPKSTAASLDFSTNGENEEQRNLKNKIKNLEETVSLLRRPCDLCAELKEQISSMLQSIRILEAENSQLRAMRKLSHASPMTTASASAPDSDSVRYSDLVTKTGSDFVTVVRKRVRARRSKGKATAQHYNQAAFEGTNCQKKHRPNRKSGTETCTSTPFSSVTIVGDSHVRNISALTRERLRDNTKVSGFCKPGAGLLGMQLSPTSPPNHCYVLMAGTNDADSGRQDVIFKQLDKIITSVKDTSRVLIIPLPTRYDLHPGSPTHHVVNRVNNHIKDQCRRHRNVEVLDISSVKRHHHTAHGLHLHARGKRFLANLIVDKLSSMSPLPPPHHPGSIVRTPVSTVSYESYAEAAAVRPPATGSHAADISSSDKVFLDRVIPTSEKKLNITKVPKLITG